MLTAVFAGCLLARASRPRRNTTMLFNIAGMEQANGVVLRAFYVIVGVMMIILVYFVVRMVRSRYRRSKTRKKRTLFEANKR
ncbi:hypothetical protein MRX96_003773 [Rhipicephalus microplus]